jgi:uncharacterized protein (DUF1330 family)
MPAYYIGEHIVSDFTLFDAYLANAMPMIERFGGRYLTKTGSHEILASEPRRPQLSWKTAITGAQR